MPILLGTRLSEMLMARHGGETRLLLNVLLYKTGNCLDRPGWWARTPSILSTSDNGKQKLIDVQTLLYCHCLKLTIKWQSRQALLNEASGIFNVQRSGSERWHSRTRANIFLATLMSLPSTCAGQTHVTPHRIQHNRARQSAPLCAAKTRAKSHNQARRSGNLCSCWGPDTFVA